MIRSGDLDQVRFEGREISVMRTLTAYGIGVVIVLAILNGIAWLVGSPRLHGLNVFSAGFVRAFGLSQRISPTTLRQGARVIEDSRRLPRSLTEPAGRKHSSRPSPPARLNGEAVTLGLSLSAKFARET